MSLSKWKMHMLILRYKIKKSRAQEACIKLQRFSEKYNHTLPLHYAIAHDVFALAQCIVNAGYNVNFQDHEGTTPIMLSVSRPKNVSMKMIKFLIEIGADIFMTDNNNRNAIKLVFNQTTNSKREVVEFFLDRVKNLCGSRIDLMAKMLHEADCPLAYVILAKNAELTKYMLTKYHYAVDSRNPLNNRTALHVAVEQMDLENIKLLVEYGADVNAKDSINFVPLSFYSCAAKSTDENLEVIRFLMDKGTRLTESCNEYTMPIAPLLMRGTKEVIRMLLQYDIDFSARDGNLYTPLHYLSQNRNPRVTNELRNVNFNVDAEHIHKFTPLMYAMVACNKSTIRFLLRRGANVNHRMGAVDPLLVSFCTPNQFKIRFTRAQYEACVEILLRHGVELDLVFRYNLTPCERPVTVYQSGSTHVMRNLRRPILAHLAKLEILKKPIDDRIREKINSSLLWRRGLYLYKRELMKMKDTKVYRSLNMFTLIADHKMKFIDRYHFHSKIVSKLSRANKNIPKSYVNSQLQKCIKKVLKMLKTKVIAAACISKLLNLPNRGHIVTQRIMHYLRYTDLKKIVKVYCTLTQ